MWDKIRVMEALNSVVNFLSAEWVLKYRANGGSAVLYRTCISTFFAYSAALILHSYSRADAQFFTFSFQQLRTEIHETIPWLGAIFAGIYAAFYARFSSQWNYLANLYNQMMAMWSSITPAERDRNKTLIYWQAGFVEDAQDLHLATKPMFAVVVKQLLANPKVRQAFIDFTVDGANRAAKLDVQIGIALTVRALRSKKELTSEKLVSRVLAELRKQPSRQADIEQRASSTE